MADEREERIQRLLGALSHEPIQASADLKRRLVQSLWDEQARRAAAPAFWRFLLAPWPAVPRWVYLTAGVLLLMVFFTIVAWPPARPILKVEQGVVQVMSSPGQRPPNLVNQQQDFKVAEGAAITLPEDGAAVISFFDRSQVELAPGTQMTLTQARPGSLWQPPAVRMQVDAGEVRAQVAHLRSPSERFEVTLPTALISVRGTIFRAWVISATHTCVATDQGVVLVRLVDPTQGYPEIEVPAGYEVHAILGQPLVLQPQAPAQTALTFAAPTVAPGAADPVHPAPSPTLDATATLSATAIPQPTASETPIPTDFPPTPAAPPRLVPTLGATAIATPTATITPVMAAVPGESAAAGDPPTPEANSRADLGVYQLDSPDPAAADGKLTYALKVFNGGTADADMVIVSNTIPAEVMLITTTPPLSNPTTGTLVWRLGTLAAGEQRMLLVETRVRAWVRTAFTNTVWLTSATPDADARNNRSLGVTRVTTATDLAITQVEFPPVVGAGDVVTCVLDYTNLGPAAAQNISLALALTPEVRFEDTIGAEPALRFIPAPPAGNGTLMLGDTQPQRWVLAELPAYASGRLIFTLKVAPGTLGWLTNTVTIGSAAPDVQPATNRYRQTLQAARFADVAITRFETPDAVLAGGVLTYSLDYTNRGPWAADRVTLTATLSNGVTFGSVVQKGDLRGPTSTGTTLMWTAPTLPADAAGTLVFTATVDHAAAGPLTSSVRISSATPDRRTGNERATVATAVRTPGLRLKALLTPGVAAPRMPFTLTVQLTNTGDETFAAGALALTATWPFSATYLAGADGLAPGAGTPLWTNSTPLTPGQSLQHTLRLAATEAITPGLYPGALTLTGRYPAGTATISKAVKLTVHAPAVALTQAATPLDMARQGTRTVTVTVILANTGPTPLTALPLQDFYPGDALRFVAAWPAPDAISPTGSLLWRDLMSTMPDAALAPGAALSVTAVFEALDPISRTAPLLHTCVVAGARDLYGNVPAPALSSLAVKPYNVYVPFSLRRD